MTVIDAIFIVGFVGGLVAMFFGCVLANMAVQEMRRVLNENRTHEDQLRWHDAIQMVAQNIIDMYRKTYPDGALSRKLVKGNWVAGIGGAVGIFSAFMLQFFGN